MSPPTTILLGSTSKHKLVAVTRALEQLGIQAKLVCRDMPSGVNAQPKGLRETFHGALMRSRRPDTTSPDNEWSIGIENGIVHPSHTLYLDVAVIVIRAGDGNIIGVGTSAGIEVPAERVHEAEGLGFDRTTVGAMIAKRFPDGDPTDPHSALTGGRLTRVGALVPGIVAAFAQALAA